MGTCLSAGKTQPVPAQYAFVRIRTHKTLHQHRETRFLRFFPRLHLQGFIHQGELRSPFTVGQKAAKFVSPYRMADKSGKNDAADAQAICEAVCRPHMWFVPVKDENQQAMQCLHRSRQGFIEEKTATYNRL